MGRAAAISTTRVCLKSDEPFSEPSGPSPLGKNTGSGFEPPHRGAPIGRCATPGLRARPPPDPDNSDISEWQKQ
jgi:hypothetical protein